jgi:ADYC domain
MMGTWKRWAHAGCAVGVVMWGSCCRKPPEDPVVVAHARMCKSKYGFATAPVETNLGNCPASGCGLNGSWLGQGFKFRELRDDGRCNDQGLHVKRFSKGADALVLQVDGASFVGLRSNGESLFGPQLDGAELEIEHFASGGKGTPDCDGQVATNAAARSAGKAATFTPDARYLLQIVRVRPQPLWIDRAPGLPDPSGFAYLYDFQVTELDDACDIKLCDPAMADQDVKGVSGTAVIFGGDTYDESLHVFSDDPTRAHRFNVACLGTAVSKMELMGHTKATQTASYQTKLSDRQMLLRLLTGDYCGVGVALTQDGVPIGIKFLGGGPAFTKASGYLLSGPHATDALWDDRGALCIGTLRAVSDPEALRKQIKATCETHFRPDPPQCQSPPPPTARGESQVP